MRYEKANQEIPTRTGKTMGNKVDALPCAMRVALFRKSASKVFMPAMQR
jgi:hypothetical protein